MLSAGRRRSESQRGQALVLVALCLPLFFAIVALVVDGATLMAKRRAIQNAADAAALAGSQELPARGPCNIVVCQPRLKAKIEEYSAKNGGPAVLNGGPFGAGKCVAATDTNCYTNAYKGSAQLVEVRLEMPVTTFFTGAAHIIGPFSVSARAVASANGIPGAFTTTVPGTTINGTTIDGTTIQGTTVGPTTITNSSTSSSTTTTFAGDIALFAKDTACGSGGNNNNNGIFMNGNTYDVTGASISNGNVTVNGNPGAILHQVVYGGPNNCTIGGTHVATAAPTPTVHTDDRIWPKTWNANDPINIDPQGRPPICTPGSGVTVFSDKGLHKIPAGADGIYCALDGTLEVDGDATITLIAKKITFNAQTMTLHAKFDKLLFYQTEGDLVFEPNNSSADGWIWVPNGRFTYGGNGSSHGFYEALDITIQGNNFQLLGNGPLGEPTNTVVSSTTYSTTTTPGITTDPVTILGITTPGTTSIGTTVTTPTIVGTTHGLDE